jgi:hypothetical protein
MPWPDRARDRPRYSVRCWVAQPIYPFGGGDLKAVALAVPTDALGGACRPS